MHRHLIFKQLFLLYHTVLLFLFSTCSGLTASTQIIPSCIFSEGWAENSVNAVVFRRNAVTSHNDLQYTAFYDSEANMILAKRKIGTEKWDIKKTRYKANTKDAHNSISIMVDGGGFLHVAWGLHGNPLQYCRSIRPDSLELSEKISMTGEKEQKVTYPEFYRLPSGNILFFYRDGSSGMANVMLNYYSTKKKEWIQLQDSFIHGQGKRNAYWQVTIDKQGSIHISWVWREGSNVATNHDICYAKSTDWGKTWKKSTGTPYQLPITVANAEYAYRIPQGSGLINQTSMSTDSKGRPYIASYWRPKGTLIPQYHLVYNDGMQWHHSQISHRKTPFNLSGSGTKRLPISRPQLVIHSTDTVDKAIMMFRDKELGNRVSIAICDDLRNNKWHIENLTAYSVGQWEPSYDSERWTNHHELHIFVQNVGQGDGEKLENIPPQPIYILEWIPE